MSVSVCLFLLPVPILSFHMTVVDAQFQSFVQFRGKLKSRSTDEIQQLKENPNVWNIHSMLNVLYSLVDKSNINKQVSSFIIAPHIQIYYYVHIHTQHTTQT